jgi:hypothetical protein
LVNARTQKPVDRDQRAGGKREFEDIANARARVQQWLRVAMITASRFALRTERKMRISARTAYLNVDFAARSLMMIRRGGRRRAVPGAGATMSQISWAEDDALTGRARHEALSHPCSTAPIPRRCGRRAPGAWRLAVPPTAWQERRRRGRGQRRRG